jgi:hypothetical protein
MALYEIDKKLEHIKDVTFKYEKEIQKYKRDKTFSVIDQGYAYLS